MAPDGTCHRCGCQTEARLREDNEELRSDIDAVLLDAHHLDDKPHRLFSGLRRLANKYPDEHTDETIELLTDIYDSGRSANLFATWVDPELSTLRSQIDSVVADVRQRQDYHVGRIDSTSSDAERSLHDGHILAYGTALDLLVPLAGQIRKRIPAEGRLRQSASPLDVPTCPPRTPCPSCGSGTLSEWKPSPFSSAMASRGCGSCGYGESRLDSA